ncbi:hypothetical protein CVT26_006639 [Gymnopilus dilepis]|uniref:Uncharacterized protein n=1 Tax=Gymnopilus dilepis TaxID=231916 RepID=A0A409Y2W9_9AGAR|nr:hypothetical protein CVT26_006639 [Gymnopilus dilepis]
MEEARLDSKLPRFSAVEGVENGFLLESSWLSPDNSFCQNSFSCTTATLPLVAFARVDGSLTLSTPPLN